MVGWIPAQSRLSDNPTGTMGKTPTLPQQFLCGTQKRTSQDNHLREHP
jgi:hypothetical protein